MAILDVQLPDVDGFEVAEDCAHSTLRRVILTSSLDGTDFGALVGSSSARGFVPKSELSAQAIKALLASPAERAGGSRVRLWSARIDASTTSILTWRKGTHPGRPRRRLGPAARGHREPAHGQGVQDRRQSGKAEDLC